MSLFDEESHAEAILSNLAKLNERLVAKGWPEMSPWWLGLFEQFYRSGKRQLVPRVGRRGGKSSSLCRLAVIEALYGKHKIPPGDTGIVAFISHSKEEAEQRLVTIKAILDVLRVPYRPDAGSKALYLTGRRMAFKVFTASIAGVSGFTSILVVCDEVSKWLDKDTGANPAAQVLTSVRPTLATQPEARMVLSSSPFSTLDAHYDAFEAGDDVLQLTAYAPTWVANPSVTEAETHKLERDEHAWKREYLAIPQAETEESLLTQASLDRCLRRNAPEVTREWSEFRKLHGVPDALEPDPYHQYSAAMDPATRGDRWTLVVFTREGRRVPITSVVACRFWQGTRTAPLSPKRTLAEIHPILRAYRIQAVYTDQHHGDSLRDFAFDMGIHVVEIPSTHAENMRVFDNLRTRVDEAEVILPNDPDLLQDLLAVRKRITRSGFSIELPHINGRHSDYAPPVARAVSTFVDAPTSPPPIEGTEEWDEAAREKRRVAWQAEQQPKSWAGGVRDRFRMPGRPLVGSRF